MIIFYYPVIELGLSGAIFCLTGASSELHPTLWWPCFIGGLAEVQEGKETAFLLQFYKHYGRWGTNSIYCSPSLSFSTRLHHHRRSPPPLSLPTRLSWLLPPPLLPTTTTSPPPDPKGQFEAQHTQPLTEWQRLCRSNPCFVAQQKPIYHPWKMTTVTKPTRKSTQALS